MAHLPPSTAIFSPSVARIAASTAKDWKYVDDWLALKFRGRKPPNFERNPDTLKVLLALATLNETADEERQLVARAEAAALQQIQAAGMPSTDRSSLVHTGDFKHEVFAALRDSLTRDGHSSLDAMALLSVTLGIAKPTPEDLGHALVGLHSRNFDVEEMLARVQVLQSHVQSELIHARRQSQTLDGWQYSPSPELARQNLELQRRIRTLSSKLPEQESRLGTFESGLPQSHLTIDNVAQEEVAFVELMTQKKRLDAQIAQFKGLPVDTNVARSQLEDLREELDSLTRKRDAVFEGLVERETPRKRY